MSLTHQERVFNKALSVAAIIALSLIGLAVWYSFVMSSPDWCGQLQSAEKFETELQNETGAQKQKTPIDGEILVSDEAQTYVEGLVEEAVEEAQQEDEPVETAPIDQSLVAQSDDVSVLCAGILKLQLQSLSWANLFILGALALVIIGIFFIRISGGKLSLKRNKDGSIAVDMSGDEPEDLSSFTDEDLQR